MKTLHKKILSVLAVVFVALTAVLISFVQPQTTALAAGTNETKYEKTNVLHSYIGNSLLIVNSISPSANNPFTVFKDYARSFGYDFNNPVIDMERILDAARLQKAVEDSGMKFENASTLEIARMLVYDRVNWTDIFADYDIFFNPNSEDFFDKGRNDPLSWALAFAQLFIKLVEWGGETAIEPLDDDCPFD